MSKILKLTLLFLLLLFLTTPLYAAISNGDIDDEDMADISEWTDEDTGDGESSQVTFDSKSCMKLDSGAIGNRARRYQDVGSFGATWVISFNLYCDTLGTKANEDFFAIDIRNDTIALLVYWYSDGLYVYDGASHNLVGDVVVQDTWQEWTFAVNVAAGTVDIYLGGDLLYSNIDCSYTGTYTNGTVRFRAQGYATANMLVYINWFKAGSNFAPPAFSGEQFIRIQNN